MKTLLKNGTIVTGSGSRVADLLICGEKIVKIGENEYVANGIMRIDEFADYFKKEIPEEDLYTIKKLLAQDPRPRYQDDPERVYGMSYGEWEVKFTAGDGVIMVKSIKNR